MTSFRRDIKLMEDILHDIAYCFDYLYARATAVVRPRIHSQIDPNQGFYIMFKYKNSGEYMNDPNARANASVSMYGEDNRPLWCAHDLEFFLVKCVERVLWFERHHG